MQVSVETLSGLERRLTIAVPADEVDAKVNEKLTEVAKTANIKGFRKGKVPLKIINRQFGMTARQEVAGDIINHSYAQAIEQKSVKPAGYPKIDVTTLEAGKDLEYTATIEIFPDIEISDFSQYEIKRYHAEINESDIDGVIESLRDQQATTAEVERAAAEGDQVNIDFTGTRNGEEFEGGKGSGVNLTLGSKSMIPGFEEGIVGMAKGEVKTLSLTFPADYQVDDLKNAAVKFTITLNKIEEKQLPEVNDEFIKHFAAESIEQFRDQVKKNMGLELKRAIQGKTKNAVMDKLLGSHPIDLPMALVSAEIDSLREQMIQQLGSVQQKKGDADLKSLLPDDMFKEQAERRVTLGLITNEIIADRELKADPDRVRQMINDAAASYQKPEELVNYYYQNEKMLAGIESAVLEDMVVDIILDQANVSEETITYEEAVKR